MAAGWLGYWQRDRPARRTLRLVLSTSVISSVASPTDRVEASTANARGQRLIVVFDPRDLRPRRASLNGALWLQDASPALGLRRRKFYSCTAIEKKYFSLCEVWKETYIENNSSQPGKAGKRVSHAIPAGIPRSASRSVLLVGTGDLARAKLRLLLAAGARVRWFATDGHHDVSGLDAADVARIEIAARRSADRRSRAA